LGQTEAHLAELLRREAAHGQMANRLLAHGIVFQTEKLFYRAVQKRFGRSISVRVPEWFLTILTCKAESTGGQIMVNWGID